MRKPISQRGAYRLKQRVAYLEDRIKSFAAQYQGRCIYKCDTNEKLIAVLQTADSCDHFVVARIIDGNKLSFHAHSEKP